MEYIFRSGIGFDVHQLVAGRACIVGGVHIDHEKAFLGHSHADVLLHPLSDALLGAAGLGDIGTYFPDTDESFKGADSLVLLARVGEEVAKAGCQIVNIDSVVICKRPKKKPHREERKKNIAKALKIDVSQVGVKEKKKKKLGF